MKNQSNTQSSNTSPSTVPYRIDAGAEDSYWRSSYDKEPYYSSNYNYDDDYAPAYKLGYESRGRYLGRQYDEIESDLSNEWNQVKGKSRLMWNDARNAVRAGWHRVERALPGDADNDGR